MRRRPTSPSIERIAAPAVAVLLIVPVALLVVAHAWSGLYGQDAFFYQAFATGELRDALLGLRAPAPFTWPPGFPTLVALTSLVTGTGSTAGQLVSLIGGGLTAAFTVFLARELRIGRTGPWPAVLAGLLVALTPHLWQSSAVVMSDTSGLAAMTLGAWALVRWANGGVVGWAVVAAAGVAFAIDTRWVYALAGLPIGVAGVIVGLRRARGRGWRGVAREVGPPLVVGLLVLAPMVGPMAWAAAHAMPIPFAVQLRSHGWDPANLLSREVRTLDGSFTFDLPMAVFYVLEPARGYHLGPLFALVAVGGAIRTLRRPDVIRVAVLLAWPVLVLGFLAGDTTQNTRFMLAALPPIAILAASGVVGIVGVVERTAVGWRRPLRALLAGGVVLGLSVMALSGWRLTESFIERFEREQVAVDTLAAQVPRDERLISFGATLQLRHEGRTVLELFDLTPAAALSLLGSGTPAWLLLPGDLLGPQWADEGPGEVVQAITAGPGMRLIDAAGEWRLWRVDGR